MSDLYKSPDISIIIPVFNRSALLKRAIESALTDNSNGVWIEIIVVDDGSSDNSLEIAQSFGPPVRVLGQSNAGPGAARNYGFAESRGKCVRFLDSDDWLLPGANTRQLELLKASGADVCYGNWRDAFEQKDGQAIQESAVLQSMGAVDDIVEALLNDKWCPNFCYLIRRELIEAVGGWDENRALIGIEDFDFILRSAIQAGTFVHLDHDIGRYFQHPGYRVSRENHLKWCNAKKHILKKGIKLLDDTSTLTDKRKYAIANTLLQLAKIYYGLDREKFRECLALIADVAPRYDPPGILYPALVKTLGYERTESILEIRRRLWAPKRRESSSGQRLR